MENKIRFIKGNKKTLFAWAFYDWANSVYALVISSSIFPLYYGILFRQREITSLEVLGRDLPSETIISYVTALGFLIIVIISPILSGLADYLGNKKFFLKLFCWIGSVSCMLLYFFSLDYLYTSLLLYMMALIGFWGSLVFYNSYLPDIAFTDQQDKISAIGFSLGYAGSVILLLINLAMLMNYEVFGLDSELEAMRISFIMVGLWWLSFSQYTYRHLPDFRKDKKLTTASLLSGFQELRKVWKELQEHPLLKKFLIAFFTYSMAVQTVMIIAVYFGEKEIAWADASQRTMGLIISILLIQVVAIIGAYLTSKASAKWGNTHTLIGINLLWVGICVYAYTIVSPDQFYIAASCVGLVMGGIQSLSRSTYSKMLPQTQDTTSYFSMYDVTEKIGIVLGMALYGFIADVTGKMQNAILFLVLFFIIGIVLLLQIPKSMRK